MLEKVAGVFGGIVLILTGVQAFFVGGYWSEKWGSYISYARFPRGIGVIFVIVGLFVLYNITRIIIRDKRKGEPR
ncbi:MAG TPA: hypothetical protein VMV04_01080 [Thermodesulfobacteriota bacterium]|nr:hypothetical protein [Thermodesulfobacteriota bacterium]